MNSYEKEQSNRKMGQEQAFHGAGLLGVGVTIRGRGGQRERTGTERRKGLFLSSEPGPG